MELNECWSAQVVEEYKGMLHEQKMQHYGLACELQAPHVIHRAEVKQDGDMWCCILGDLPTGVVGFGTTPKKACDEFDRVWHEGYKTTNQ